MQSINNLTKYVMALETFIKNSGKGDVPTRPSDDEISTLEDYLTSAPKAIIQAEITKQNLTKANEIANKLHRLNDQVVKLPQDVKTQGLSVSSFLKTLTNKIRQALAQTSDANLKMQ